MSEKSPQSPDRLRAIRHCLARAAVLIGILALTQYCDNDETPPCGDDTETMTQEQALGYYMDEYSKNNPTEPMDVNDPQLYQQTKNAMKYATDKFNEADQCVEKDNKVSIIKPAK